MNRRHAARLTVVALAGLVGLLVCDGGPAGAVPREQRFLIRVDGRIPSTAGLARASGAHVQRVRALGGGTAVVAVRGGTAAETVRRLDAVPSVRDAAPERRMSLLDRSAPTIVTPLGAAAPVRSAEAAFASEWDLWDARSTKRAGGYGIDAARAWTRALGSPDVVVAVLDTGITDHPDLAGASIEPGYDFVSGTGGDSADGDGWDADPTDPGDACAAAGEASSWHGTFVAGELVARHDGRYVAGAAPGVTLLPVRVLGACGGAESDTIAAITWASGGEVPGVPAVTRRADVISMSLGSGGGACSAALQAAVDGAIARGTTVVAAAGNDGDDVALSSPANCTGVVSVTATTRAGGLAAYSNRGGGSLAPTIAAPGGSSADPVLGDGWTSATGSDEAGNRAVVVRAEGTSMAAPRVAAAAALLLSVHPGLAPAEVAARLVRGATSFPARSDCSSAVCGAGVVNAGNVVGAARRFVLAGAVTTRGRAHPGATLRADPGRWHPLPATIGYRWLRNGRPIAGAASRSYRVRTADVGHRIAVRVVVRRPGAIPATATSHVRVVR